MITIKTIDEIETMRKGGKILAQILGELAAMVHPGLSTAELEEYAKKRTLELGGVPAFQGYDAGGIAPPFPTALCVSLNEEIVHAPALPARILQDGDLVSLDYGIQYPPEAGGLYTDMAVTVGAGLLNPEKRQLVTVTRRALMQGLKAVKPGNTITDVSSAIEKYIKKSGNYGIVREFVGHGVGHAIHEDPRVPNYNDLSLPTIELKPGMCLAIEPMVTVGAPETKTLADGWTAVTADGSAAAHFELTVVVTTEGYEILTKV